MNRLTLLVIAGFLACGVARAQNSAGAQVSASDAQTSASGNATAGGQGAGAQTSGNGATSATANGSAQTPSARGQGANTQASGSSSSSAAANGSAQAPSARGQNANAQASGSSSSSAVANGSAQTPSAGPAIANGATMSAKLIRSLDAKVSKPGDEVKAQVTKAVEQSGAVALPKGTILVGHVTQAVARDKSQTQSTLGVVFDRAVLRSGQAMSLPMTLQALAPSPNAMVSGADSGFVSGGGGPITTSGASHATAATASGLVGGAGQLTSGAAATTSSSVGRLTNATSATSATLNSAAGGTAHAVNATGGLNASGNLTSNSRGVFGMPGVSLASTGSGAAQASTIMSSTRNVHLDGGTQMVFQVAGQTTN